MDEFAIYSYNEKETKPGFYCGLPLESKES